MTQTCITDRILGMWATAPETEGVSCDVADPVEQALCKYPELRGVKPAELARLLGVTPARAQIAILNMTARMTGKRVIFQGLSFDEALSEAGRSEPRASMQWGAGAAPDARATTIMETIGVALRKYGPAIAIIAGTIAVALDKKEAQP